MHRATRRQLLGIGGLAALAGGAAVLLTPAVVLGQLEHVASRPLQFGLALVAVYLLRPFLFWPVSLVAVVLGYLFGPVAAMPIALVGAGFTGLPPFLIARYARSDVGVLSVLASPGHRLVGAVGQTRGVIAARFSPVPGDVVSYAAGLSEVSVGAFLLGTVVGEIPWAVVAVLAGDSMRTLAVSGFQPRPLLIVAIAALGLAVLGGPAYRRLLEGPLAE